MRTGGCQCGQIRYAITGEALALYVCHCLECQKQSASAFSVSLQVQSAGFRLTQGEPKEWTRDTDSGNRLVCAFCPNCGSRLFHRPAAADGEALVGNAWPGDTMTVKAGSLDEPVDLRPATHIWVSRKLPGVEIPEGAAQFPEEPA
ncbi:GFA family protein [Pendulispora albinea]|uniref:GFA family protein n=1 Tax=Pendulispora albinea TaxID=2741071 RepID=A0ABZ2MAI0_9BACT